MTRIYAHRADVVGISIFVGVNSVQSRIAAKGADRAHPT